LKQAEKPDCTMKVNSEMKLCPISFPLPHIQSETTHKGKLTNKYTVQTILISIAPRHNVYT